MMGIRFVSDSLELKETIKKHSKQLANLGMEISQIKFSYKIQEKTSKEYWEKRIKEFEAYKEKSMEYYNTVCSLMKLINLNESNLFLLQISKFHQITAKLLENMNKVKENPSIINSKDKQQSSWSKKIRQEITDNSNESLNHEKEMNTKFREFYENNLKDF